jgi:hypothetical protein
MRFNDNHTFPITRSIGNYYSHRKMIVYLYDNTHHTRRVIIIYIENYYLPTVMYMTTCVVWTRSFG